MNRYRLFLFALVKYLFPITLTVSFFAAIVCYPPIAVLLGITSDGAIVNTLTVFLIGTALSSLLVGYAECRLTVSRLLKLLWLLSGTAAVFPLRSIFDITKDGYVFPFMIALTVPALLFPPPSEDKPRHRAAIFTGIFFFLFGGFTVLAICTADPLSLALLLRVTMLPITSVAPLFTDCVARRPSALPFLGRLLPFSIAASVLFAQAAYWFLPLFLTVTIAVFLHSHRKKRSCHKKD